jgi:N-acyl-D-aspartate/D-glutamate deacylase
LKAADMILKNGKITTLEPRHPEAQSVAIKDGRIVGIDVWGPRCDCFAFQWTLMVE